MPGAWMPLFLCPFWGDFGARLTMGREDCTGRKKGLQRGRDGGVACAAPAMLKTARERSKNGIKTVQKRG